MADLELSDTPLWEKLIGLGGFALIAVTVAYLLWAAVTDTTTPPLIEFEINEVTTLTHSERSYYLVNVTISNHGDQTVTGLNVQGQLMLSDDTVEESEASIEYLAPNSWKELGFYFYHNPDSGELVFQALNYQIP